MTQQQIKALEDEARTRITADEGRSARFHRAVERVSAEVESLARRLEAEENENLQRVNKIEVGFLTRPFQARFFHSFDGTCLARKFRDYCR